jgi:choline-sulfatase
LYSGKRPIGAGGADYYDSAATHAALEFLSSYEDERPFYLQVDYINPHDICEYLHNYEQKRDANPEIAKFADDEQLPPLPDNFHYDYTETILQIVCRRVDGALIHNPILQATKTWTELHWRYYICNYYRFIKKTDREIGL